MADGVPVQVEVRKGRVLGEGLGHLGCPQRRDPVQTQVESVQALVLLQRPRQLTGTLGSKLVAAKRKHEQRPRGRQRRGQHARSIAPQQVEPQIELTEGAVGA